MNVEETTTLLAKQFSVHIGMGDNVALMAARRYVTQYFQEGKKDDLPLFEMPAFGKWVGGKLKASGIVNLDRIEKMVADFNGHKH